MTRIGSPEAPALSRRPRRLRRALGAAAVLALLAAPAAAQDQEEESGRPLDRRFFEEQLLDKDMRQAIQNLIAAFGPVFQQFTEMMEDIPQYEAPEILPNGDILIRRKQPLKEGEVKT